jgi:hypothetical protein
VQARSGFPPDGRLRRIARHLPLVGHYERRIAELKDELAHPELVKAHVIDTVRLLTGAVSFVQLRTPVTAPDLATRPEVARFEVSTALIFVADQLAQRKPNFAHLPRIEDLRVDPAVASRRADIVFVDPWHTYEDSVAGLALARSLLAPGGTLIVHDCLPEPKLARGVGLLRFNAWCGDTWKAFAELALTAPAGSSAVLIDADQGIGIVRPAAGPDVALGAPVVADDVGPDEAYGWFRAHIEERIPVIGPEEWRTNPRQWLGRV